MKLNFFQMMLINFYWKHFLLDYQKCIKMVKLINQLNQIAFKKNF